MGSAEPAEKKRRDNVVPIDGQSGKHPAPPLYAGGESAEGAGERPATLTDHLRSAPAQLAEWALIFAVLGILIGGLKWWEGKLEGEPPDLTPVASANTRVAAAPGTEAATGSDRSGGDGATTASPNAATTPAAVHHGSADPAPPGEEAGIRASNGDTGDFEPLAEPLAVPVRRAPAQVPYPRRTLEVQPVLPAEAAGQSGFAVLALLIDANGDVAEIEVLRGNDEVLDAAVIAAARQWKFVPTVHEGGRIAVRGNFTVRFGS